MCVWGLGLQSLGEGGGGADWEEGPSFEVLDRSFASDSKRTSNIKENSIYKNKNAPA